MSAKDVEPPTGLISVGNLSSSPLVPSEIYDEDMEEWGQMLGNHLYLVTIGPRVNVASATMDADRLRVDTNYYRDGWRPRTLHLPLPEPMSQANDFSVSDGVLVRRRGEEEHRYTGAQLARMALDLKLADTSLQARNWRKQTIEKFFDYSIVYVGQAYGRDVRRSAVKRLADGHKNLQRTLAMVNDHYRNSDVGLILMDAHVQDRELNGSVGSGDNDETISRIVKFLTSMDGPLEDKGLLIDAAEAMLIRYFQPWMNDKLKEFPLKDRPGLVGPLLDEGITHLGVQIDLTKSYAILYDPVVEVSTSHHRFAVNLSTGHRETPGDLPLSWRMYN